MNFAFVVIFGIFRTIEVLSLKDGNECVKRKSGACKAINIPEDFDHFIELHEFNYGNQTRITTIIEFDYTENKYSYELEKNKKKKEFDTADNPVVEILFSENKNPSYSYRLVLGEKLNRLAYIEIQGDSRNITYNNYSPDLPAWPFAINVTVDMLDPILEYDHTKLSVYTKNGDGFDKEIPFLLAESKSIGVQYMSFRSRNKNIKLAGFYDCSTKFGLYCGFEKTQTITDCREKLSPLGSGLYNNFIQITKFNRLWKNGSNNEAFNYDEIFGIYRRNNDNMYILFSSRDYESGTYVRLTIGDEIVIRMRTVNAFTFEYYERTAVKKGWNQEPSEPNFIRVTISSESKQISVYSLDADKHEPILTMKLCNVFDDGALEWMSVSSERFKTVELYYDCCLPNELHNCHVYERNRTKDDGDSMSESTTTRLEGDETTTLDSTDSTISDIETTDPIETTMEPTETTKAEDIVEDEEGADIEIPESTSLKGITKTKTFLDTTDYHETGSTLYLYENGTSMMDYCPHEIAGVQLTTSTAATKTHVDDEDSGGLSISGLSSLLG